MLKVDYPRTVDKDGKILEGEDNFETIAWHNVKESAKTQNIQIVVACSKGWFKANPEKTVLDFEKQLREEDIAICLLAKEPVSKEYKGDPLKLYPISKKDSDVELKYELNYICQKHDVALSEIKKIWESAEVNQSHLLEAGELKIAKNETETEPDAEAETEPEPEAEDKTTLECLKKNDILGILSNNFAKMESRMMTQKEVNDAMNGEIRQAEAIMGKKSEAKQIGQTNAGQPVYAHYVNGRVVSRYGMVVKDVEEEGVTRQMGKIILVQDRSSWKW